MQRSNELIGRGVFSRPGFGRGNGCEPLVWEWLSSDWQ
ncbi:hypothetical protein RISK_005019 [Rhodopirellula islandica]|uniref:Uncharacterized protein n=1 Tax=Rhodopirellula islandica TaxID=595434 RepID=A0A0J1EBW7_RHOIS|nr:hypothetical protein RISK_005019 [Rhodopirellula islandica]